MDTGLYIGPDNAPDRYRLLRSIGRGGEAVLYLAELELSGATEPVVVKVLDARQTLSQELFSKISEKWREQAELLRFVHRLGVVGIREHFEGPSAHPGDSATGGGRALYLVMNHVEGLDLRDWRAERTLETPAERREAVRCLEQLADVLDWLHGGTATPSGRTVVHGDLSPGNVMIDANGQATLVDFGLSKLTADHQTAEVWFTPGFAAPEVFEGKRSPATDRYAFGAIAYFLLSGESPATMPETLRADLLDLPELAAVETEKAAGIASIFATDPAGRPDSLAAWVRQLRPVVISTTTRSRPAQRKGAADAVPPVVAAAVLPPPPAHAPGAAPTAVDPVPALPAAPPQTPPPPPYTPQAPVFQAPAPQTPAPQNPAPQNPAPPTPAEGAPPAAAPPSSAYPPREPQAAADPGPSPAAASPQPLPAQPDPETRPTVVLGAAAPPAAGGGADTTHPYGAGGGAGGGKRSRKPRIIVAAVVALLLVGGGAYAGIALSGDSKGGSAASGDPGGHTPGSTPLSPGASAPAPTTAPATDPGSTDPGSTGTGSPSPDLATFSPGDRDSLTTFTAADSDSGYTLQPGTGEINGSAYDDVLHTDYCGTGYMEYNLAKAYSTFDVLVGLDDNHKNLPMTFAVSADGTRLAHDRVGLGTPQHYVLKVTGALRLRIDWSFDDNLDCGVGVLANPTLIH